MRVTADREQAIESAKDIIARKPLYLDTETTGMKDHDEIIEICILNWDGEVLLDSLVNPTRMIPPDATRIHGITYSMVRNSPPWSEVWEQVVQLVSGHIVGIYNADFDIRMMKQSHNINQIKWDSSHIQPFCIMKLYAKFYGQWNDFKRSYRWQSLENAGKQCNLNLPNTHRAKDDTLLTRAVLHHIAGVSS
jgi:DNA polymerase-3 subunit epsilon